MAEARELAALRRAPLAALHGALAEASDELVSLREVPFLRQLDVRADEPAARALGLPLEPNTLAADGDRTTLWLGPDQWLAAFPWHRAGSGSAAASAPPTLAGVVGELADRGVTRFVLAHGGRTPDEAVLRPLVGRGDVDVLVAGGVTDVDGIRRLRDLGIAGLILGEALLSGSIDLPAALEAAA